MGIAAHELAAAHAGGSPSRLPNSRLPSPALGKAMPRESKPLRSLNRVHGVSGQDKHVGYVLPSQEADGSELGLRGRRTPSEPPAQTVTGGGRQAEVSPIPPAGGDVLAQTPAQTANGSTGPLKGDRTLGLGTRVRLAGRVRGPHPYPGGPRSVKLSSSCSSDTPPLIFRLHRCRLLSSSRVISWH